MGFSNKGEPGDEEDDEGNMVDNRDDFRAMGFPTDPRPHVGGSFAPPLDDDKLARYEKLAKDAPDRTVARAMQGLLRLVKKWWELPESKSAGKIVHAVGLGYINNLDDEVSKALADDMIDKHEFEMLSNIFDGISASDQKELRDACFHLLWHARELQLGREPMTHDKV